MHKIIDFCNLKEILVLMSEITSWYFFLFSLLFLPPVIIIIITRYLFIIQGKV